MSLFLPTTSPKAQTLGDGRITMSECMCQAPFSLFYIHFNLAQSSEAGRRYCPLLQMRMLRQGEWNGLPRVTQLTRGRAGPGPQEFLLRREAPATSNAYSRRWPRPASGTRCSTSSPASRHRGELTPLTFTWSYLRLSFLH